MWPHGTTIRVNYIPEIMSFWKKSGYSYQAVVEISETELATIANALTRADIMEWLMWNDPNGVYSDEQSLKEFGNIMTRNEGLVIMLRQAEENRIVK
jgi:hypothetical protein